MKDAGFFLGFFLLIVFLAISVGGERERSSKKNIESPRDTERSEPLVDVNIERREPTYSQPEETPKNPPPALTPKEVEKQVAEIYEDLGKLKEEVRAATLRSPASPYVGKVTLRTGSTNTDDPDREYLTLRAETKNTESINISRWYLRSYVTEESASIPDGDRLIERWRSPNDAPIFLDPGESAYLITGDSPIDVSFRENICTGYLTEKETFYPSINRQCPSPKKELERFGTNIDLDNDRCYEFIERLGTCVEPDDELYTRSKVGGACSVFVEDTFNHDDCVRLHRYDPFFAKNGSWRIYLGERTELWRSEREIIQLMDEADRVVSVIEY